jgi:ribonuclease BN (tRNA processing enzyme)
VEVEHVPDLDCYGYLFELPDRVVGYSGDTHPCTGLDDLAANADVLVLECNTPHDDPRSLKSHMDLTAVEDLRRRYPNPRFVLTHLGGDPPLDNLPNTTLPNDFDRLDL